MDGGEAIGGLVHGGLVLGQIGTGEEVELVGARLGVENDTIAIGALPAVSPARGGHLHIARLGQAGERALQGAARDFQFTRHAPLRAGTPAGLIDMAAEQSEHAEIRSRDGRIGHHVGRQDGIAGARRLHGKNPGTGISSLR